MNGFSGFFYSASIKAHDHLFVRSLLASGGTDSGLSAWIHTTAMIQTSRHQELQKEK